MSRGQTGDRCVYLDTDQSKRKGTGSCCTVGPGQHCETSQVEGKGSRRAQQAGARPSSPIPSALSCALGQVTKLFLVFHKRAP